MQKSFEPDLYATIAQTIPFLFGAVFLELVLARERKISLEQAGPYLFASLTLLIGAELVCLRALNRQVDPTFVEEAVMWGGLLWPASVVVVIAVAPIAKAISRTTVGWIAITLYGFGLLVSVLLVSMRVISFGTWIAYVAFAPVGAVLVLSALSTKEDMGDLRTAWKNRKARRTDRQAAAEDRPENPPTKVH